MLSYIFQKEHWQEVSITSDAPPTNQTAIMELLWKYAEGTCSPDEKAAVEKLLASDPALKKELENMMEVQSYLVGMEGQSPSLRFTQNVMEALPQLYASEETEPLVKPIWMKVFAGATAAMFATIFFMPQQSEASATDIPYLENVIGFIDSTVSHLLGVAIQFPVLILLSFAMLVFIDKMLLKCVRGLMMV